jgi:parvulin-like peptidyl-prolyl isomerase
MPEFRRAWLALALIAAASASSPAARAEAANRIIARVNDRIATLYDYDARLDDAMRRADDLPEDAAERQQALDQLARDVMKDMFEELLLLSRADQLAITVTPAEVTEAINRMREANGLQDDKQFRTALAQSGLTPEMLEAQFEQQMRSQRVIGREVYSEVKLEEEDLRRYYRDHLEEFREPEQVKLREVVVLDDTGASPAAVTTAAGIASELRAGKELAAVVGALPSGSVSQVIELGWVAAGDLDPALKESVWSLAAGEWSAPTRARGGVHLAQVMDRRESIVPAFKDVEEEIRSRQERARMNERMEGYLAELEKKSYLYLDPPPQAAGFRTSTGETPSNVEFPFVAPGTIEESGKKGKNANAEDGEEAAEDAAEDAPEPDAPPASRPATP